MIVSEYVSPEDNIYCIGARLIELISTKNNQSIDIMKLYNEYIKRYNNISFEYYIISLVWLYMLNLIDKSDNKGNIKTCF